MASPNEPTAGPSHLPSIRVPKRRSRLRFPHDSNTNALGQHVSSSSESVASVPTIGIRRTPLSAVDYADPLVRRRVVSAEHASFRDGELGSKIGDEAAIRRRKRHASNPTSLSADNLAADEPTGFSDEYDLSHNDPRLLQDVQRALQAKARREARAKLEESVHRADIYSPTYPFSTARSAPNIGPEVDFAPSTGIGREATASLHPVPTSVDDGATLDWTGASVEDDKKWPLISKWKGKEKETAYSVDIKKQEKLFNETLKKIRAEMSPQTHEKAEMVKYQLGRQYKFLFDTMSVGPDRPTPLKITRWLAQLPEFSVAALEAHEPFTWLKHLDKNRPPSWQRTPWYHTALIRETYVLDQRNGSKDYLQTLSARLESPMSPILEDQHMPLPSIETASPSRYSLSSNPLLQPVRKSVSPAVGLAPSLSRKFPPDNNVRISLEGTTESSARVSIDKESRRSTESVFSRFSASSHHVVAASPPTSLYPRKGTRGKRMHFNDSDASSVLSDRSEFDIRNSRDRQSVKGRVEQELKLSSLSSKRLSTGTPDTSGTNAPEIKVILSRETSDVGDDIPSGPEVSVTVVAPPSSDDDRSATHEVPPARRLQVRRSLPTSPSHTEKMMRQREEATARRHREYVAKAQLLEEVSTRNARVRTLMHRIAVNMKECDLSQSQLARILGLNYNGLPQEVLESFSHDPSAVTGATRRVGGYKAVEDIHRRIERQRQIFRDVLSDQNPCNPSIVVSSNVLEDPIQSLMKSLDVLEGQRQELASKARLVDEQSRHVQAVHTVLKAEYNAALAHTSTIYPELPHIVALEENYKDQYLHLWEFGMDVLTLLLDTVTPFWRTYGKTIGDDVQDFLIIPWYRNEFTGEAKRYPIARLPRRSFRHWVLLISCAALSMSILVLQGRTAVTSVRHIRLDVISYTGLRYLIIPFFWVSIIIQWCAVLVEAAIVTMQLAGVVWWLGWSIGICK